MQRALAQRNPLPLALMTMLLAACGETSLNSPSPVGLGAQNGAPVDETDRPATTTDSSKTPPASVEESPQVTDDTESQAELTVTDQQMVEAPLTGCRPGAGISGAPGSIDELVALINSLPKPTTLPCFIESLERPLDVFLTKSGQSGQPAVGAGNPRVFVFYDRLSFTIVPGGGGESSEVLEIAERTTEEDVDRKLAATRDVTLQAVHGEIGFPVYSNVTDTYLQERISAGNGRTLCGGCHLAERLTTSEEGYFEGAVASNIMAPFQPYDVDVEYLRNESVICDPEVEAERCELLSAIFDFGEVRPYDFR